MTFDFVKVTINSRFFVILTINFVHYVHFFLGDRSVQTTKSSIVKIVSLFIVVI